MKLDGQDYMLGGNFIRRSALFRICGLGEYMKKPSKMPLGVLLAALVFVVFAVTVILVLPSPPTPAGVRVEGKGFERYSDFLVYTADIYVGGEDAGTIYVRIPLYYGTRLPLLISISHVDDSTIKSLRIEFEPPREVSLELAWLHTTMKYPVRYYQDGWKIVWECDNMDMPATLTLEFVPLHPRPDYFMRTTITLTMNLSYKGTITSVTHVVPIRY